MNTRPATVARVAFAMGALLMAAYAPLAVAGKSEQPTYLSAEEASHALFLAARNHDERTVTEILQAGDLPVSADEELEDRLDRERFVQKYEEMHRFVRQANGSMTLYIGAENWPFPIPLVSRNGAWRFDSDVGASEIRYRRIGENELTAIALCQALVAQSHPGADGATDGPAAGVLAAAKNGGRPVAFHGGLRQPRRRPRLSHCVPVLGCHDVRRRRGWRRVRKRPRPEHGEDCRNDDWVSYRPHVVACRSEELRRTDRTSALTLTTRALVAGEFGITTRPPALTVASSAG